MPLVFFTDTATTEIYTLSLHDALPISTVREQESRPFCGTVPRNGEFGAACTTDLGDRAIGPLGDHSARGEESAHKILARDRKSTRLNSSHTVISYAVFCLKKKKKRKTE